MILRTVLSRVAVATSILCVALCIGACGASSSAPPPPPATSGKPATRPAGGSGAAREARVAVLDLAELIRSSAFGKTQQANYERSAQQESAKISEQEGEAKAIQAKIDASRATLSPDELADLKRQLDRKSAEVAHARAKLASEMPRREERIRYAVEARLAAPLGRLATERRDDVVFNWSSGAVAYADASADLTASAIQGLDAAAGAGGTTRPGVPPARAAKLAVVDADGVAAASPAGKLALASLRQQQQEIQAALEAKRERARALSDSIARGGPSLSAERLAQLTRDHLDSLNALRNAERDADASLKQARSAAEQAIAADVTPALQSLVKEHGYTLVLRRKESGVVHSDGTADVTAALVARLTPGGATGAAPGSAARIGILHLERLLTTTSLGRATLANIERRREEGLARIQSLQAEIHNLSEAINAGGATLPPARRDAMIRQLDAKLLAGRAEADAEPVAFEAVLAEELSKLEREVSPAVSKVAKQLGCSLVLRKAGNVVLYADERTNITDAVVKELGGTPTGGK